MSSLVSTGNCKLGHDCRRVCSQFTPTTRRNCRQLVANSCTHRRRDATGQFRLVGGVYWALITTTSVTVLLRLLLTEARSLTGV